MNEKKVIKDFLDYMKERGFYLALVAGEHASVLYQVDEYVDAFLRSHKTGKVAEKGSFSDLVEVG